MKNVPDVTTLPSGTFFVDGSGRFPDHAEVAVRQERQSRSESADDRRDISLFSENQKDFGHHLENDDGGDGCDDREENPSSFIFRRKRESQKTHRKQTHGNARR